MIKVTLLQYDQTYYNQCPTFLKNRIIESLNTPMYYNELQSYMYAGILLRKDNEKWITIGDLTSRNDLIVTTSKGTYKIENNSNEHLNIKWDL